MCDRHPGRMHYPDHRRWRVRNRKQVGNLGIAQPMYLDPPGHRRRINTCAAGDFIIVSIPARCDRYTSMHRQDPRKI